MGWLYLLSIVLSIFGMLMLDLRYKLAFFKDYKASSISIAIGVIIFTIWDIFGIHLGIFFSGKSDFMSGIYLYREFPVEELFFLFFLCYITLILYRLLETKWLRI